LCCTELSCVVLCFVFVLGCIVLCLRLHFAALSCLMLCRVVLCSTVLCCIVLWCVSCYCALLCYSVLSYTVLLCSLLLYCIVLCHIMSCDDDYDRSQAVSKRTTQPLPQHLPWEPNAIPQTIFRTFLSTHMSYQQQKTHLYPAGEICYKESQRYEFDSGRGYSLQSVNC
jgi:hypothetical protein